MYTVSICAQLYNYTVCGARQLLKKKRFSNLMLSKVMHEDTKVSMIHK